MTEEVPWEKAPLGEPIWCVYGPESFPTVFLCKILDHPSVGRVVWGFSIYRRAKGFRTLGTGREWAERNGARFFLTKESAFSYIEQLFPELEPQAR